MDVLLHGGLHVAVHEGSGGVSEVGADGHVLGELRESTESNSDGSFHELGGAAVHVGEHEGVLEVHLGQFTLAVVGNSSEFVQDVDVTPDSGSSVNVVRALNSSSSSLLSGEVVLGSDTARDISVNNPPLVEDVGVLEGHGLGEVSGEVGVQVGLGSLSESLTSVMESHGVAEGVLVVVPDGLSTDVDLVVSIFPDETSSFLSNGIEVNGSGGYAISVLHGDLADFLGLVSSLFLFPDNVHVFVG